MAKAKEIEMVPVQGVKSEPVSSLRLYDVRMEGPLVTGVVQVKAESPNQAKEILIGWFAKSLKVGE